LTSSYPANLNSVSSTRIGLPLVLGEVGVIGNCYSGPGGPSYPL